MEIVIKNRFWKSQKSFLWSFETQFLKKREENFDLPVQHFFREATFKASGLECNRCEQHVASSDQSGREMKRLIFETKLRMHTEDNFLLYDIFVLRKINGCYCCGFYCFLSSVLTVLYSALNDPRTAKKKGKRQSHI